MVPSTLPITRHLKDICQAIKTHPALILQAPPGAGKTTAVPLACLPLLNSGRQILMLEPRRLAARMAAQRMADLIGEPVGRTIGYQMRGEQKMGTDTRIRVVTEGILTRLIQSDPELADVDMVIFDEFHERSIHADLGLTLAVDIQEGLREDMRLMLMSATPDIAALTAFLPQAHVCAVEGRSFPVDIRYQQGPAAAHPANHLNPSAVARAVTFAMQDAPGDVLVFLPGVREIHAVAGCLQAVMDTRNTHIIPLHGMLDKQAQHRAVRPSEPGFRKIVLATAIAETSLTLDGIKIVIDTGLSRKPVFSAQTGLSRLLTVPATRAAADQRAGRAGRTSPGICWRLWPENLPRPAVSRPEIREADLTLLMLEIAHWGVPGPEALKWIDPPPEAACASARRLLALLSAITEDGQITSCGKQIIALGTHPRLGHMLVKATAFNQTWQAALIAALVEERDIFLTGSAYPLVDIRLRIEALHQMDRSAGKGSGSEPVDQVRAKRILETAATWLKRLGAEKTEPDLSLTGRLISWAYPDRIGTPRSSRGTFTLSGGTGARLPAADPLATVPCLVVPVLTGSGKEMTIRLAAPCDPRCIASDFSHVITTAPSVRWNEKTRAVTSETLISLGNWTIRREPLEDPPLDAVLHALLSIIQKRGLCLLPWTRELKTFQSRVCFLKQSAGMADYPDFSDAALLSSLDVWLAPWLHGIRTLRQLEAIDLKRVLSSCLNGPLLKQLDRDAPTHLTLPTGSRIRLDYAGDGTRPCKAPVLAVRLQELFGVVQTPRIAGNRVPVIVHLLSPAMRPMQMTQDLESFWKNTYPEVRKELRGRYPKHHWPKNPLSASPTRRTRPRKR
ncbi:MAG: ATP-dependent helicase HrpB [Deltaproteobacteria bacterium]|nr:MAG: ATP-dependent helicase HrpB [Deltaproteobacteria bacterium]